MKRYGQLFSVLFLIHAIHVMGQTSSPTVLPPSGETEPPTLSPSLHPTTSPPSKCQPDMLLTWPIDPESPVDEIQWISFPDRSVLNQSGSMMT